MKMHNKFISRLRTCNRVTSHSHSCTYSIFFLHLFSSLAKRFSRILLPLLLLCVCWCECVYVFAMGVRDKSLCIYSPLQSFKFLFSLCSRHYVSLLFFPPLLIYRALIGIDCNSTTKSVDETNWMPIFNVCKCIKAAQWQNKIQLLRLLSSTTTTKTPLNKSYLFLWCFYLCTVFQ